MRTIQIIPRHHKRPAPYGGRAGARGGDFITLQQFPLKIEFFRQNMGVETPVTPMMTVVAMPDGTHPRRVEVWNLRGRQRIDLPCPGGTLRPFDVKPVIVMIQV
jgi:hypothetical protein